MSPIPSPSPLQSPTQTLLPRHSQKVLAAYSFLFLMGCPVVDNSPSDAGPSAQVFYQGRHVSTLSFGANDNSEVVKLLPTGDRAVLIASKARKLTLLRVDDNGLEELQNKILFPDDNGESELTHVDFNSTGTFAAITRTLPVRQGDTLVDCQGSIVFVDLHEDRFGDILLELPVGPMPDAVDISDDDKWAVTADEVDFNDGKCDLEEKKASVTVVEIPDGDPTRAVVRESLVMQSQDGQNKREPEQIIFAANNDTVAVTLQDTHEVLFFSVSDVQNQKLVRMPNRDDGAEPWPDGVARIQDAAGEPYFVVAGEYNDTFALFDLEGELQKLVEIRASDVPSDLPRNLESWSLAPFRPDSAVGFSFDGHQHVAFSLKHAGAVGVWNVDDIDQIYVESVVKIGNQDTGTPTTESSMGTEGISANNAGFIVTANEGESSASLVAPLTDL
ncbi:MAG: hypothetical protein GY822_25255 [Deltaproteobacteria bacterium]|nr:hypothetical protein [Deltaproteobacteria bacterium]